MKNILKILKYFILIILIGLAAIFISVFIQTKVNPDKVPSIFGYKPFIVLSGSMETEIYKGDLVIVKKVDTDTLKTNDIIAFREENKYVVTHRIVEVTNNNETKSFITKGDNNNANDAGMVNEEDIEGIYIFKIDGFGNVLLVMQKPLTLGITLGVIVIIGILWITLGNDKLSKDERKELEQLRKEKQQDIK